MSVDPPVVYSRIKGPRRFGEKKTFLYNRYSRIFEESGTAPIIFFQHSEFSIPRLIALRREIAAAASKHATPPPSLASPTPAPANAEAPRPELPKLMFINSAIFGVVLREQAPKDSSIAKDVAELADRGMCILTLPELNPPQLNAVLKIMSRLVPPRKPKTPEEIEAARKELEKTFVPGRGVRKFKPDPVPNLKVLGALIEGRVFKAAGVQDVAKLPNLDTLRAQLVGLISAPATQLAGVLSQASGGKLARTLEGLKKSLEEAETSDAPPSS